MMRRTQHHVKPDRDICRRNGYFHGPGGFLRFRAKKPRFTGLIDGPGGLAYKPRQSRTINDFTRVDGPGPPAERVERSGDKSRETDLSAEQTGAQAPPRLSHPDGDQRRPQSARVTARARPQAAQCLIEATLRLVSWNG